MQGGGDLVDRSVVWRLRLFVLGVDVVLPRIVLAFVLVGCSSAAVYQQLAPAECGGSFSVVPVSMACGEPLFPVSLLMNFFLFDKGCAMSRMPLSRRMQGDVVLD